MLINNSPIKGICALYFYRMPFKKIILINIFLFIFIPDLLSQVSIQGSILNKVNEIAIPNANIYIENTSIGTISNTDGKFNFHIPMSLEEKVLVISSIGYQSLKINIKDFKSGSKQYLIPEVIELDEVTLLSKSSLSGNEIVQRALNNLHKNYSDTPYISNAFFRHIERNKKEYKWLIESAITVYDPGTDIESSKIKININETKESLDLRDIDTLFLYQRYLMNKKGYRFKKVMKNKIMTDTASTSEFVKAIEWNDNEFNGLINLFKGKLNIFRNLSLPDALFGDDIFEKHSFSLDTTLIENNKVVYKIKVSPSKQMIDLKTDYTYNGGLAPIGWLYVYGDNYAIKEIEYALVASSINQKLRSKLIFDTRVNHKIKIKFIEYKGKMFPKYYSYEAPKNVNFIFKPDTNGKYDKNKIRNEEDRYYYTKQEILFNEIITDKDSINEILQNKSWNSNIFTPKPYNESFWDNYNILLENQDEKKMRLDLERKVNLKEQFKQKN